MKTEITFRTSDGDDMWESSVGVSYSWKGYVEDPQKLLDDLRKFIDKKANTED